MAENHPEDRARKRPSPSINENVFEVDAVYDDDPLVVAGRKALRTMREAAERSQRIALEVLSDEMEMPAKRHKVARERIFNQTKPAFENHDKVIGQFATEMKKLETELMGPHALALDKNAPMKFIACQQALYGLPQKERARVIKNAIEQGDDMTLSAVLRFPAYLSKLTDAEQQGIRLAWQRKAKSAEVARLVMLKGVLDHVARGGQLLLSYTTSLTDSRIIEEAEAKRQRVLEAAQGGGSPTLQ